MGHFGGERDCDTVYKKRIDMNTGEDKIFEMIEGHRFWSEARKGYPGEQEMAKRELNEGLGG